MHPSRPIRGASDQRLPTRGGMRWPDGWVWRCAPRLRRSKPQQSRRDQRSRHRVLWRQRRNSVPNGQALSRPKAVVSKLRPPGALRSKPQTPRAGRRTVRRTCGSNKTDGRRSLAGSPLRFGVARCRSPRVRRTPASRAPSDLSFRERNRSCHDSGAQKRAARTMEAVWAEHDLTTGQAWQ